MRNTTSPSTQLRHAGGRRGGAPRRRAGSGNERAVPQRCFLRATRRETAAHCARGLHRRDMADARTVAAASNRAPGSSISPPPRAGSEAAASCGERACTSQRPWNPTPAWPAPHPAHRRQAQCVQYLSGRAKSQWWVMHGTVMVGGERMFFHFSEISQGYTDGRLSTVKQEVA